MLQFDHNGHLMPPSNIELSMTEFEQFFVDGLDDRTHRRLLFENYLRFLDDLRRLVNAPFFQWIDGSFVTQKPFPGDMDLVTFMDVEVFQTKSYELTWLKAKAKLEWSIDCNAAMVCKPAHFMFEDSIKTRLFWQRLFGTTKTDRHDLNHPKGFIQLNFES